MNNTIFSEKCKQIMDEKGIDYDEYEVLSIIDNDLYNGHHTVEDAEEFIKGYLEYKGR